MLAYSNPKNYLLFASFEHLASSFSPRRVLCVVDRRKGMNLVVNLDNSKWGALGLCGCGMSNGRGGFVVRCQVRGGDWDLEGQILEFMKKSKKPKAFPSKKELIEAGRMDLVMGIEREGGWLALGWDLEDEVVGCVEGNVKDLETIVSRQRDSKIPERGSVTVPENGSIVEDESMGIGSESSPELSSSVGTHDEATGIKGILSRLEKERSSAFGVTKQEREMLDHVLSDNGENNPGTLPFSSLSNTTVAGHDRGSDKGTNNDLATTSQDTDYSDFKNSVNNLSPDMWRSWSNQKTGISDLEFEAADIPLDMKNNVEIDTVMSDKMFASREGRNKTLHRITDSSGKHYSPDFIRSRLRSLELELSATLQSPKSKCDESISSKVMSRDLSEEMQNASDAWEFLQTEVMRAKDALRSIRAKLAVLEGKMTMAIIDARKTVEVKQKKIDQARHAFHLLRIISITWPNSASEVLLAGSFDGWTTQRKMEKSASGIHSLSLKLYPGIYEIKFIVDGIWRIDPLRPITSNYGFENNLLIVN